MEIYELMKDLNFISVTWQIITPLCFSVADFVTGYIQAVINHNVESKKMRIGLLHKTLIFLVILLSFILDFAFNLNYISSFVCVYVVIMEITSILENLKRAGINVGKFGKTLEAKKEDVDEKEAQKIEKIVKIINEKGDEQE